MEYAPTSGLSTADQYLVVAVPICNGIRSYMKELYTIPIHLSQSPSVMEYAPTVFYPRSYNSLKVAVPICNGIRSYTWTKPLRWCNQCMRRSPHL